MARPRKHFPAPVAAHAPKDGMLTKDLARSIAQGLDLGFDIKGDVWTLTFGELQESGNMHMPINVFDKTAKRLVGAWK